MLLATGEINRIRNQIRNLQYGSAGPNPYPNVTDPEPWKVLYSTVPTCLHTIQCRVLQKRKTYSKSRILT
jgi:hypothetical protein